MGSAQSAFTEQELDDYQTLTYLTKKEILHVYKRFYRLDSTAVDNDKNCKLSQDKVLELPELKVNPFGKRICQVFSSDGQGNMTFEDFLDMMSVFSDNAPKNVKVEYAFRIYDFDEDDMLSSTDLRNVVDHLTSFQNDEQKLSDEDMQQLIDNILEEADLDDDDSLSFAEFEHVISKAPDFVNSFRIRL
ncbi:calcium and integrin-binding protein 1-like [Haliotis rufescens]|uniref:calcium and integrin-binding protein 1-like n=1 Tax=Haliotis rufescens TaxID=6454 RepID=UPI001EAFE72C|nr:calcium and integrin-binding protein 1-like [Haliotis rufescens]